MVEYIIITMQYIGYFGFRLVVFVFSLIPFWLLYLLADGIYFLLYRVFSYRIKVVRGNLERSFPEKSIEEIRFIERASYRNLADVLVEGIKGFGMSEATMRKRYVFLNPELLNNRQDKGGNSIAMGMHYGNWEWGVFSFQIYIKSLIVGYYKPLTNKIIDNYVYQKRAASGIELTSIKKTAWSFEHFKDRRSCYVFVSDQSPSTHETTWVKFLNQDTACLYGADKYARQTNFPVYFLDMHRVKRGYYTVKIELICENPGELAEGDITRMYMTRLEQKIVAQPNDWLWSHKRWKLNR
jgi:Kdo2-lipid IVA lauroyltransferase/acyltransferase